MRFNSVKRGNFSGLASSVNRSMNQAFSAARQSAVDHTSIAKESIKGRGLERRAAMKADADVSRAGMQAFAQVKNTKNDIESKERINDIKRPAKRMAGIVGGLGAIAGGYVMMEGNKKDKAERDELRAYRDELDAKQDARDLEQDKRFEKQLAILEKMGSKGKDEGSSTSDPKPSASVSSDTGASLSVSSKPISSAEAPGAKDYSGSTLSQAKITSIAEQVGFNPENAKVMGAIAMGESGGRVGIDTVQSGLDPNRSNEFSVGVTQINTQAHMDKLNRRGYTVEDMRDPVKNLTIAKEVFDEVESFKPWSVYKNNKHLPYLK